MSTETGTDGATASCAKPEATPDEIDCFSVPRRLGLTGGSKLGVTTVVVFNLVRNGRPLDRHQLVELLERFHVDQLAPEL